MAGGRLQSPRPAWTSGDIDGLNHSLARNRWLIALRGVLALAFALLAFAMPVPTPISLILIFAACMLVDGIFALVASWRAARHGKRWGSLVLDGIVTIITGVLAAAWPGITAFAFVVLIAAWSILPGSALLVAAARLKRDHGWRWLALGGLASIAFGILQHGGSGSTPSCSASPCWYSQLSSATTATIGHFSRWRSQPIALTQL